MTRTRDLLPASWKGIPFFVRSEVLTEGGRRIVLHDYPNSSERFVEDMGQLPPKFSVTAFVTGEDYIDRAEQLERALQEEGAGRLSMPTFGSRTLFALPYRKDASQRDVGEIRFELSFVAGAPVSGPVRAASTVETVYSLGDTARLSTAGALEKLWVTPTQTANVLTAQFDLSQFVLAIDPLRAVVSNIIDFDSVVNYALINAPSIVRSGLAIADAFIRSLWQTTSVGLSGGRGLSTLNSLTSFGSELSLSLADIRSATITETGLGYSDGMIPVWPATTGGRVTRNKNRLSIINSGRICALISAYEQAADANYGTDSDIDDTRVLLEDAHRRLMRIDTEDRDLVQSQSAVRSAVEAVRLATLDILDQKAQAVYSLTEIKAMSPVSAFLLSYELYAEKFLTSEEVTSRGVELRALNPSHPADKLVDNLMVLQE